MTSYHPNIKHNDQYCQEGVFPEITAYSLIIGGRALVAGGCSTASEIKVLDTIQHLKPSSKRFFEKSSIRRDSHEKRTV